MSNAYLICDCGVCGNRSLDVLWDLPKLPLTEKYGTYAPDKQLQMDQKLLICNGCGHVQLGMQISPSLLYTASEYSFRTSQSRTAVLGTQFFFDFFHRVKKDRNFDSLLDVGGNDLFLAKMIEVEKRCVVDPVCSKEDGQTVDGVKIIGRFIEQVDFKREGMLPDVIFCRHVLEHVAKPRELLNQLFQQCHPEALYIFEIPCFENLMEANRFDAIFHQHYHYFDLEAFQRLIAEAGGHYLTHSYNRQGSCGGALLIAFEKGTTQTKTHLSLNIDQRKQKIRKSICNYKNQMELLGEQLQKFHKDVYGYGASLMLATLAYHLNTDLSDLICVLDDDPQKHLIGYQNVPIQVQYTGKCVPEANSNFLITSLENTRNIFKRILDFSPRRILVPLVS